MHLPDIPDTGAVLSYYWVFCESVCFAEVKLDLTKRGDAESSPVECKEFKASARVTHSFKINVGLN